MKIRIKAIPFILVLLVTFTVTAQEEKLSALDILKWFPLDTYESISHVDEESVEKAASKETLVKINDRYDFAKSYLPLPPPMKNNYSSFTTALKVKLLVYEYTSPKQKGKRPAGKMAAMIVGDKAYAAESTGFHLGVYRFADLDSLIKEAEKAGHITPTTDLFDKRYIYKTSANIFKRQASLFLYPSVFQELLVCENLNILKKMIATGYGNEANILDEQEFTELADIIPDLGPCWDWMTFSLHWKVILNKAEKEGAAQEEIDKRRDENEKRALWQLTSHDLGREYVQKEIQSFADDDFARAQYERMKNFVYTEKIASQAWFRLQLNAKKYEHDGNLVIATTAFTKDLVENIQTEREKEKKRYEEAQEKQKTKAAQKEK